MEKNEVEHNDTAETGPDEEKATPGPKRRPLWLIAAGAGVIVIIVLAVVLGSGSSSPGGSGLTLTFDGPAEVAAGSDFTVKVANSELTNFDSANYDVVYDPKVIEVTGVSNGSIDGTLIPVVSWSLIPTGIQGTARLINNVPGFAGVNGSGYLAEVHFTVVGSAGDSTSLTFDKGGVFDNTAAEVSAKWVGNSLRVK